MADQLDAARRYGGCGCPVFATTAGVITPGQTDEPINVRGAHVDHRPGCPAIPAEDAGLTELNPSAYLAGDDDPEGEL